MCQKRSRTESSDSSSSLLILWSNGSWFSKCLTIFNSGKILVQLLRVKTTFWLLLFNLNSLYWGGATSCKQNTDVSWGVVFVSTWGMEAQDSLPFSSALVSKFVCRLLMETLRLTSVRWYLGSSIRATPFPAQNFTASFHIWHILNIIFVHILICSTVSFLYFCLYILYSCLLLNIPRQIPCMWKPPWQ